MHTIPAYTPRVTLFATDGQTRSFSSLRAALDGLGMRWIAENVGEHFCQFTGYDTLLTGAGPVRTPLYRHAYVIVRTDVGEVVTAADFRALIPKRVAVWRTRGFSCWSGEGAVPYTGKRRGGRYFRRLGTVGARRQAQCVDAEEPAPRAARNATNIPNSWDDYAIAAREDRSWKRHRRTQWKVAKA